MEIEVKKINENISLIKEVFFKEHCNCYIIEDFDNIIIIDFGIGGIDFSNLILNFNNKNIIPVLTHFHFDHFLGYRQFKKIYCSAIMPKDLGLKYLDKKDFTGDSYFKLDFNNLKIDKLYSLINKEILKDGDCITTKNLQFRVIYTPGHDSSLICLYEEKNKWLFCSDLIYNGKLLYDLEDSNLKEYKNSLERIKKLDIKYLFPGHNEIIKKGKIRILIDEKLKEIKSKLSF